MDDANDSDKADDADDSDKADDADDAPVLTTPKLIYNPEISRQLEVKTPLLNLIKTPLLKGKS